MTSPSNDRFRLLFIHIRKTAGVSVRNAIVNRFAVDDALLDWHFVQHWPRAPDRFGFVTGHCGFTAVERYRVRPRILVFVRDPLERALSAYFFYRNAPPALLREFHDTLTPTVARERERFQTRARELDLLTFLQVETRLARHWLGDVQTRVLAGAAETDPDPESAGEALLAIALSNLQCCDVVGLTERLADSLTLLGDLDDRLRDLPAPKMNRTLQRSHQTEVPTAALDLLREWNQRDAALYRAACARFEEQWAARGTAAAATVTTPNALPDGSDFTFDQPILGRGWHPRERHDGRWLCWTGPECVSELRLSAPGPTLREFTCRVAHVLAPDVLDGLQLEINGVPVNLCRAEHDDGLWLRADLSAVPSLIAGGAVTIRIATPRTLRPTDLAPDCGDDRLLGVALDRIQLRAVPSAPQRQIDAS